MRMNVSRLLAEKSTFSLITHQSPKKHQPAKRSARFVSMSPNNVRSGGATSNQRCLGYALVMPLFISLRASLRAKLLCASKSR